MSSLFSSHDTDSLLLALASKRLQTLIKSHHPPRRLGEPFVIEKSLLSKNLQTQWNTHVRSTDLSALLARCEEEAIRPLLPHHPEWPSRLFHLGEHAPRALFVRGSLPPVPHIALIGARAPSAYGLRATDHLVNELRPASICLLSGLALGIDGRAHEQALRYGLPTTAILGLGVAKDQIYPVAHHALAERILAAGGALISEVPPGQDGHRGAFPERNRLLAALCQAAVVIEAKERSGTLITARIALELGREVLAVPGSIFSFTSRGTNALLAAGAHPCVSADDIWRSLRLERPKAQETRKAALHLNTLDQPIIELLRAESEGLTLDQCTQRLTSMPAQELTTRFGLLELQGLIQQTSSGRWTLAGLA